MRRNLPPLRLMTAFEAVIRSGGIQNAALELNVTQPAVSQAVRALEDHVGVKLFDRNVRPATPTESGHSLYEAVSQGMDRMERALEEIGARAAGETEVNIACTVCTGTYWLMPRLAMFYGAHPDISARVVTSSGVPHFAPGTDLLIRYRREQDAGKQGDLLFREKVLPVCQPEAFETHGAGDFEAATLLHVRSDGNGWAGWEEYFDATGLSRKRRADRVFDNYVQATQAALAGMGVMLGWVSNTADLLSQGRLSVYRDRPYVPGGGYYLSYPQRRSEKKAVALLATHLKEFRDG
ncbi:LysR substrate-binding domain-containing protein [Acuticoccus sediminis]|nr:LysR substrate-binding domain-containing protein [Acuticoccus sediminis]